MSPLVRKYSGDGAFAESMYEDPEQVSFGEGNPFNPLIIKKQQVGITFILALESQAYLAKYGLLSKKPPRPKQQSQPRKPGRESPKIDFPKVKNLLGMDATFLN